MSGSFSESYKEAGVDITAGYRAVELMKPHIQKTQVPGAIGAVGGFGGLFAPDLTGIENPVLVSGTDGVGTKLKIAFLTGKHDTVGIDCVAMCANDVVCAGAKPLFFLDYLAVGKNEPEMVADIVKGVAQGCVMAGCALIGGETAEMPGFYTPGEYDLAGFCVGLVSKEKITDFETIAPGDILIGLASSGVHSNGFSLVRRALGLSEENIGEYLPELGRTLGEELLTPTRIYVKSVLAAMAAADVKGVSHITGGGFYENIPRMLPRGITARVKKAALPAPPVFSVIASRGKIPERDMYNTFNMGVGMVLACAPEDAQKCLDSLRESGERAAILGVCERSENGEKGVVIE